MFRELGELVTRHPWPFVAVWIVVLLLAVPLAATFSERLSYNVESFIPGDMESVRAGDLYKEQFPGSSRSQMIVVVRGDPGTATAFIDRLNASVANGSIDNLTSTTSIYEVQREALASASPDLHRGLHDLYANVSEANAELYAAADTLLDASRGLYDLRDNVTKINGQLYSSWRAATRSSQQMYGVRKQVADTNAGMYQMQGIADVLFGLPDAYAQIWTANAGIADPVERKYATHESVKGQITASVPGPDQPLALSYIDQFNQTWDPALVAAFPSPAAYADQIVSGSSGLAVGFVNGVPGLPSDQRQMMLGVAQAFTVPTYKDTSARRDTIVTLTMNAGGLTESDRPRLAAIYGLGPNPSAAAVDSLTLSFITAGMPGPDAARARELYALGNDEGRIGQYIYENALAGQDNETVRGLIADAWNLGLFATNETFDKYVLDRASEAMNGSERQKLEEIYAWGESPNASVVRAYILNESGKDLDEPEKKLVAEFYDLGRNPGNGTLKQYTVDKINENLELKGNLSYFYALLDLDRNATKPEVEAFARQWACTHGIFDPQILPGSVVESMATGDLTLYMVGLKSGEESPEARDAVLMVRDFIKALLKESQFQGLKAYVTGGPAMALDAEGSAMEDVNNIDKVSIVLILLILGLYFRSFLTPLVPLIIIAVGIVVALGALYILSFSIGMFYLIMTFVVVIMLGAGTDYCVFTLSRYAEERALGRDVKTSVIAAVEHAGKSVASSGSTAMIGFGALLLIDQGMFGGIGISVAVGILISILVALTLLPAVLTIAGDRLFWPRKIYNSGRGGIVSDIWSRITRWVLKHSVLVMAMAVLISIPAVYFSSQLTLGNDFVANMAPGLESKQGFDAINEAFGSGSIDRIMVLMVLPGDARDASGNVTGATLDRVDSVSGVLAGVKGVDKVYSMTRPDGDTINYRDLSSYPLIEREYYRSYMNESIGNDDRTIVLYASLEGSPYSIENNEVIDHIRSNLTAYQQSHDGATFMVGGMPAAIQDYQTMCTDKYNTVYIVVFIGIFLVLAALLRSVFTPLRLIVTLLMSVFWTLAAYVLVFQVWMGASTIWILPIFLFCALMGLGVDYDIFLVSRVREEVLKGKTDEQAIEHAVEATGTIITLCGAVMASAFGSMLISSTPELREFGFVLLFAIILDATIVRLVLVPSIMVLMKKYNWWMPFIGSTGVKR